MFLDPWLYEGQKFLLLVLTCAPHVPSACKIWILSLCRLQPKFFLVISGYQSNCLFLPIWTMGKHEKSHLEPVSYHIGYGFKVVSRQYQGLTDTVLGSYFLGLKDTIWLEDLTKGLCGPYALAVCETDYGLTRLSPTFSTQNRVPKPLQNPRSMRKPYLTRIPMISIWI